MPNMRKKGKKLVSAWVPEKLHAEIVTIAKRENRSASDVIDELLSKYANNHPLFLNDGVNSGQSKPAVEAVEVKRYVIPCAKRRDQTRTTRPKNPIA